MRCGEKGAIQPLVRPPWVWVSTALRNIAPPSTRKPGVGSPKKLSSSPWLTCWPARTWVLLLTLVMTLGWLIWNRLAVVVSLPQSTFTPASYWVDTKGGKIVPALAKVGPTTEPGCRPWMKLP